MCKPYSEPNITIMLRRKNLLLLVAGCVAIIVVYDWKNSSLAKIMEPVETVELQFRQFGSAGMVREETAAHDLILKRRLKHVVNACGRNKTFPKINSRRPVFFRSKSTNTSCCKVPKSGSSFWGAIVMAIESTNTSKNVFHINRNAIHGHKEIHIQTVPKSDTKVLVTRDPYTRLYSAFIDKYYLLGRLGRTLMKDINASSYQKGGNICGYNVSFNQFLDFVAKTALSGKELDEHLVPVSDLCDACAVKYDIVIRQETLNSDTLYLLSKTNLTIETKMAINAAVSPKGIKNNPFIDHRAFGRLCHLSKRLSITHAPHGESMDKSPDSRLCEQRCSVPKT